MEKTAIVIPAGKALNEAYRIAYPLTYLAEYGFSASASAVAPGLLNPETGGVWAVEAPVTAEAPPSPSKAPKAASPVPEPAADKPGSEDADGYVSTSVAAEAPDQTGESPALPIAVMLLMAAVGVGAWVWKKYPRTSE